METGEKGRGLNVGWISSRIFCTGKMGGSVAQSATTYVCFRQTKSGSVCRTTTSPSANARKFRSAGNWAI